MLAPEKYLSPMKPMTGAEENRNFLRAFIHTYRDLPVLWDTSLRDYTNRDKRAEAYDQLVPIYRYLKRDANVEDVKKKINTLRTNYRKELKVVEGARRNGTIHHPRCWTFHELDFLRNTEKFLAVTPSTRGDSFSAFGENSQTQASFIDQPTTSSYNFRTMMGVNTIVQTPPPSIAEMFHKSFGSTQKLEPEQTPSPGTQAAPCGQQQIANGQATSNYHQAGPHTEALAGKRPRFSPSSGAIPNVQAAPDELLNMACDYLSATFPEEESLARTWTHKLKRLQREQRLLAEKFINEILFEAESGTLHRGSVQVVNTFEPFVRFEESPTTTNRQEHHSKSQSPSIHTSTAATISLESQNKGTANVGTATRPVTESTVNSSRNATNDHRYGDYGN